MNQLEIILRDEKALFSQCVPGERPKMDETGEDVLLINGELQLEPNPENQNAVLSAPKTNTFHELDGKSAVLSLSVYNGFGDVYGLDEKLSKSCQPLILCDAVTGRYEGLTWYIIAQTTAGEKIIAMMGIRASIANIILGRKGAGRKIMESIINLGKTHGCSQVVAVWPLESLIPLLTRLGFVEATSDRFVSVTKAMCRSNYHWALTL